MEHLKKFVLWGDETFTWAILPAWLFFCVVTKAGGGQRRCSSGKPVKLVKIYRDRVQCGSPKLFFSPCSSAELIGMPKCQFSVFIYVWHACYWGRVRGVEKTANTIFRFLFDLPQLISPSVSHEVLFNTLWWSWMFPGRFPFRPQAVLKQARYVNVNKNFQDWCHGVFKAASSLRSAPTIWCTSTSIWAKLICVTWD